MSERRGASFTTSEVVDLYRYRPPYPEELFRQLVRLAPAHQTLLDLGCGEGKISRRLASHFRHVTAVDPSSQMIKLGQSLPNGDVANIEWIEGLAEEVVFPCEAYDLVVAALSIHWMDHARLFQRLKEHVQPNHVFAIVSGDQPVDPPWESDWQAFLQKWVPAITGVSFDPEKYRHIGRDYQHYIDITNEVDLVSDLFHQSVDDFVKCQHSRDTFALFKLGDRVGHFDAELVEILTPHASDGVLSFHVKTTLTWSTIREAN